VDQKRGREGDEGIRIMKAPFPWFGGKRRAADLVWSALGDVHHYVEPFAGSLAVLLERPKSHNHRTETVNDLDYFIANFWRAVKHDPERVADFASDPVNECDLVAKHSWLVRTQKRRRERLEADPNYYSAKVAGWWVWGICSWIGAGWCSGQGPWVLDREKKRLVKESGRGINRQRPHLGDSGQGISRKRPHLGDSGQGINRQRPHLGDSGQGINRQRPHLGNSGQGINRQQSRGRHNWILAYMIQLSERLEDVRVICGDWTRVLTMGALTYPREGSVGIFLDPPYDDEIREKDLYTHDGGNVSRLVRDWAVEHGEESRLRIVLAGYQGEHKMPDNWVVYRYSVNRAYGTHKGKQTANTKNRHKEVLWLSPHTKQSTVGFGL